MFINTKQSKVEILHLDHEENSRIGALSRKITDNFVRKKLLAKDLNTDLSNILIQNEKLDMAIEQYLSFIPNLKENTMLIIYSDV